VKISKNRLAWVGLLSVIVLGALAVWWFSPGQQQHRRHQALLDACAAGDLSTVQDALARGTDVNARDENGITPLMVAAKGSRPDLSDPSATDHPEVVQCLVEHGAEVNAATDTGFAALLWAARYGHAKVVRVLLDKGANVNARDQDGLTALKWATTNRVASPPAYDQVIALLKEAGAKE
jgi:uncharacterized protein